MRPITLTLLALALLACGGSQNEPAQPAPAAAEPDPCGPGDDVEQGAKTAGASAELGGRTAVEGVKTAGKTVGGFFEGGSDEAKEKWNEGKEDTRETAKTGAKKVQTASTTRPCTPRAPK